MNAVTPLLLLVLAAFAVAAGVRSLWLRGVLEDIAAWWRGASRTARAVALAFFIAAFAYGSDKTPGGGLRALPRLVAALCTNAFTEAERLTGYAVSSVATNEAHDFAMPDGAVLAGRIARRGAHDDGFWLRDSCTNRAALAGLEPENPVWIHTDGTVSARTPAPALPIAALPGIPALSNATVYAPLQGSYGFLPASLWETYGTSRIWTAVSPLGSRVVTWEGARLGRDADAPVSFQAEFRPDGGVAYRYESLPTNNVTVGLFRHGSALLFALSMSSTPSTIHLSYVGDLGDGTSDTDGDGLIDWEEVKVFRTDPRRADSDGDGLDDYAEVHGDTDPNDPDSDGDGIADGWTAEAMASHRLLNPQEDDRLLTLTLAEAAPPSNRAVVRIGDLPILLGGTNTWTLSMPTGTVWSVELTTAGAPVRLNAEGAGGVFIEDGAGIFASCSSDGGQEGAIRPDGESGTTAPQQTGGSRGGCASVFCPSFILTPAYQIVHGEPAFVHVLCAPQEFAALRRPRWSFDPAFMSEHVSVAEDGMSAMVSDMDGGYHSVVELTARAGTDLSECASSAIVGYCDGHNWQTNVLEFSQGHTSVEMDVSFRDCDHLFYPAGDEKPHYIEIEAGRETAAGWQHLAWVDTDPASPGLQRRSEISLDNPPDFSWNAKAGTGAPLSDGADSFTYDSQTQFHRALPAVAAGQYVPPPYARVITRVFDNQGNQVYEFTTDLPIPQYVKVSWDAAAIEEIRQPITFSHPGNDVFPATNVTFFFGCSVTDAADALSEVVTKAQALLPAAANIVFVGPDQNVPQPHKTVAIQSGYYHMADGSVDKSSLGATLNSECHQRNDSPTGMSGVYLSSVRDTFENSFRRYLLDCHFNNKELINNWDKVSPPFGTSQLSQYLADIAVHEFAHAAGLVPDASAAFNGHNDCSCAWHLMDSGHEKNRVLMHLRCCGAPFWKPNNVSYLEFVCPR